MSKLKIGHDFQIPEELLKLEICEGSKVFDIGGYKVIPSCDKGVLIQGFRTVNLFDLPIGSISIIPLDEDGMSKIENFPFEIEKHHLVYSVGYSDFAWYFNKREEAYGLMDIILQVKENALHNKWLEEQKTNSDFVSSTIDDE